MRVQTVTVDSVGDQQTYHLGIQVGVPTLTHGQGAGPQRSSCRSSRTSGAFGIAKAFDNRLRGQTFVAFIRRYANDDGDVELHWHLVAGHGRGGRGREGGGRAPGDDGLVSNVSIKTVKEVDAIRVACQMAAETLLGVGEMHPRRA